jgi:hypothetical protein
MAFGTKSVSRPSCSVVVVIIMIKIIIDFFFHDISARIRAMDHSFNEFLDSRVLRVEDVSPTPKPQPGGQGISIRQLVQNLSGIMRYFRLPPVK